MVSHMRSESTRGLLAALAASESGASVHVLTVERSDSYLVTCSEVRGAEGDGLHPETGWRKGVLAGSLDPSTVAFSKEESWL